MFIMHVRQIQRQPNIPTENDMNAGFFWIFPSVICLSGSNQVGLSQCFGSMLDEYRLACSRESDGIL